MDVFRNILKVFRESLRNAAHVRFNCPVHSTDLAEVLGEVLGLVFLEAFWNVLQAFREVRRDACNVRRKCSVHDTDFGEAFWGGSWGPFFGGAILDILKVFQEVLSNASNVRFNHTVHNRNYEEVFGRGAWGGVFGSLQEHFEDMLGDLSYYMQSRFQLSCTQHLGRFWERLLGTCFCKFFGLF